MNVPLWGIADPVSAATHLFGLSASGAAGISLWRRARSCTMRRTSTAIYALSSSLLYLASTAYHTWGLEPERATLRRLDHAMIYVLIAGTYTPIVGHLVRDPLRRIVLTTVWLLAILGVIGKLFFFGLAPEWLDTVIYVAMGWFGIVPFGHVVRARSFRAALWLPLAGVLYSFGALSELFGWPIFAKGYFGFHEVFHLAVLGGSACFYAFVCRHVLEPERPVISLDAVQAIG